MAAVRVRTSVSSRDSPRSAPGLPAQAQFDERDVQRLPHLGRQEVAHQASVLPRGDQRAGYRGPAALS